MPKLYQVWPGNNRFLLRGITGKCQSVVGGIIIYVILLGMIITYCVLVLQDAWISSPALPILFLCSIITTVIFLNLISLTDPGILPRRDILTLGQSEPNSIFMTQSSSYQYCQICQINQPIRTYHCKICNNCVEVYDHHSRIFNTCIGKRNYRYLVFFLISLIMTLTIFILDMVYFLGLQASSSDSIALEITSYILLGFALSPFIFFIGSSVVYKIIGVSNNGRRSKFPRIQWFKVDPPLINFYQELSRQDYLYLKQKYKPQSQRRRRVIVQTSRSQIAHD